MASELLNQGDAVKGLRQWAVWAVAWLMGAAAHGQTARPILAVGAFEGDDESLTQAVRQQVVQILSRSAHLQIADRAQLRAVLQERRLRELGLTGEPDDAPLATAQWLLVGRISSVGGRIQIELSCHDIRTGLVLTGGVETGSGARADWEPLAQRAAERLHRRLTGKSLPVSFAIEPLPDEGVPPTSIHAITSNTDTAPASNAPCNAAGCACTPMAHFAPTNL